VEYRDELIEYKNPSDTEAKKEGRLVETDAVS
jgi:hypothetical protein